MPGQTLTVASKLTCPHGGTVTIVPANLHASASGSLIATTADKFVIEGCPFTLPTTPPTPSPCVTVQWQVADLFVKAGDRTLSTSSAGLCISALGPAQGPVSISPSQTRVSSQ